MDDTTPDRPHDADLIDRVVAWHNRSALACRITPAQVTGIGVVGLPFTAPADSVESTSGGALRAALAGLESSLRALSGRIGIGRRSATRALFSEDFIPPLKPRLVARFAARHGELQRPGDGTWLQRDIQPTTHDAVTARSTRYLRTAAIEYGSTRLRVLIGSGSSPAIIGPRLWSRRRMSGLLAGLGSSVVVSASVLAWIAASPIDSGERLALADTPAALPVVAASASGAVDPSLPIEAPVAAAAAVTAASAAPTEAVTLPVVDARPDLPPGDPPVDDVRSTSNSSTSSPTNAQAPPRAKPAKPPAASSARPTPVPAPTSDIDPIDKVFALAAEPTRSRIGSMLRLTLLDLPTEPQKEGAHAELMRTGAQWRVVIWPYANRQAAEQARGSLASRGVKVELIAF